MKRKTKLVRDGNSWAVRLPKPLLEASGLEPGANVVKRFGSIFSALTN